MKSPIIATILLVLAAPALASPRHPTPAQWKDINTFTAAWTHCGGYDGSEHLELIKSCDAANKLEKKLTKQGFCIMVMLPLAALASQ